MKLNNFLITCMVFVFFFGIGHANAENPWTQITVPLTEEGYSIDVGDEERLIYPSCALSSITGEPYSFYIKPGKADKMVIYLNGGGACWNDQTCNPASGVYVPTTATASNDPNNVGGLFAVENSANPYKDWTMVYMPYCTGDVFAASKDTTYVNTNPAFPFPYLTIHHRGFDNFLYVMDYMRGYQQGQEKSLGKLVIAGSSAGSYGASLNFPWAKEILELDNKSKAFLVSDGGNGVITDAFLDDALFGDSSSWNINTNLHSIFYDLEDRVESGTDFISEVYQTLSWEYPKDKFGQYTTAYDAIQVLFLNIMINDYDPAAWFTFPDWIFGSWSQQMFDISSDLTELSNYRRYIEPGCNHTIFRFPEYYTSSIEGITFLEWMTAMTGGKHVDKDDWANLNCTPGYDCEVNEEGDPIFTTQGVIEACLARTFGS